MVGPPGWMDPRSICPRIMDPPPGWMGLPGVFRQNTVSNALDLNAVSNHIMIRLLTALRSQPKPKKLGRRIPNPKYESYMAYVAYKHLRYKCMDLVLLVVN